MRWHKKIIIVALLATASCAWACGPSADEVVMPDELLGRWTTANPAYADRYLELSATGIVLGTGGPTRERYSISRVLQGQDDNGVLYTLEYTNLSGSEYAMSFYFDAAGGGSLRFKNQLQMTWRKATS